MHKCSKFWLLGLFWPIWVTDMIHTPIALISKSINSESWDRSNVIELKIIIIWFWTCKSDYVVLCTNKCFNTGFMIFAVMNTFDDYFEFDHENSDFKISLVIIEVMIFNQHFHYGEIHWNAIPVAPCAIKTVSHLSL